MDETIYLKYPWKIEDKIKGFKYYKKSSYSTSNLINILLGIILIILGVAKLLSESFNYFTYYLLVTGVYLLFCDQISNFRFKFRCKKLNYENKLIEWEISKDKIVYRMINLSESIFHWELFQGVLDTPEGFLLYLSKYNYYWLPKNGFESEEDVAHFVFIAQDRVKNFQQIISTN